MRSFTPSFFATVLVTGATVQAAIKPYIETSPDYNTECKTCPRSLCPNKIAYDGSDKLNVTCWTRGTKIMGDNLWLKSEAGCYVTQYDIAEYPGDYTTDLKYCGRDSEVQKLTIQDAKLKYKTECRICPELNCDVISYLNEDTDVKLTCWYPDGQLIIDDPYWLKTTNNCYVAQKNLYSKPNLARLDNCGPVPLLEIEKHNNANGTSDINRREPSPEPVPVPVPESKGDFSVKYLINVTVGEEYAYCHTCTNVTCPVKTTYEFDQEVWLQCLQHDNNSEPWSLTTDFCYVKDTDFWQSPGGDNYRFPSCDRFNNGGKPLVGEEEDSWFVVERIRKLLC